MAYNLPAAYQPYGYSGIGQQMYQAYQAQPGQNVQTQQSGHGLIWVDGEVGAKAYQMPNGWPANQPIALWDTNDTIIYLKSMNPMGMPNPLQKAHYTLEEHKSANPMRSGDTGPDLSGYVRKEDLERMKTELMEAINGVNTSGANRRSAKGDAV